ncbi:helix-turn-helix transcriptional regulator [Sulfobacillus acidophilus]|uniref:Helix-turn-helix transcriptional regulator n=1 Tax=Sulfobacillus acidophilus TaxID=53633 RepID=A0ABS3B0T5_9FIRM|nr:helix-turn-helix transcriptional regulator [Sulfobacillus acidophilus]
MSAVAKTRLTEIVIGSRPPKRFKVPAEETKGILLILDKYRVDDEEDTISAEEVFKRLYAKTSKAATLIRGYRTRDSLTQAQLAKKLGTSQSALGAIETGERPISKAMAKKLAKLFDADYRSFL